MENLTGQTIKGYELRERIGAGGFGAVYKAYQSTVGREVAIKIILPHFANHPDFIRRFETEAQLVARLEHLHIIPLYDYWRDPDGAYLVMRWLKGGSLREVLQTGAFTPESAVLLLDQISAGLAAAHRNHVIHRDLKPGNILLDEDGNAYLADFGIAIDVGVASNITEPDTIVGSPDYLAPEQARNEPVTPATDIYSLGVVLYEILTGQHPFPNITMVERLFKHLNEPLPEISTLPDNVRDGINGVIQKATAKNPLHRYADVLELAAAFHKAARTANGSLIETLTQREQQILGSVIEGRSNKEIAQELFITVTTVKWHITQIYHKLGVRSRVQAIVRARELNLIPAEGGFSGSVLTISGAAIIPTDQFQPENPYKGLRAFQPADNQDFFGREKLVEKLVKRMGQIGEVGTSPIQSAENEYAHFLAVVGPSGSGKSSLVKAGLIPAIWRGDLPGSEKWFVVEMLPGTHPLDELEVALTRVAANQTTSLNEHLKRDRRGLVRAASLILPHDDSELLVVIDQFEEVFTLVEDEAERAHFLDILCAAVTEARSRVRVVVTLRADFYDRPLHYPEFGELIRGRMETVLPLSTEGLERAIARPAERAGVSFEPGLVAAIIGEINYQAGALPLLQYALTELFENRQGRVLTRETYQAIGRTTGALGKRAEEIYLGLDAVGKEAARQMFLRLVTLGEGAEDTRRRVARSELLAIGDGDLMDEGIDAFATYRLLSLDNDPGTRTPTVEVAHEAILREWERLRDWLNDSRHDIHLQRQLAHAADEWSTAGQESSFLLRGARLEASQKWVSETRLALTATERSFLEASLVQETKEQAAEENRQAHELKLAQDTATAERRSAHRLRYLVGVLVIFLVVAAGLSILTLQSRNNAISSFNNSESQRLAAESANALQRGDSPELAALLAIRGLQAQYSPQADGALQKASRPYYGERVFDTHERLFTVAFSPDGHYGLTSGSTETRLWDLQTGVQLRSFAVVPGNLGSSAFSPDGQYILVGDNKGTVHLWETATGVEAHTFNLSSAQIATVAFSPDGHSILTGSDDHSVRLMDAVTGAVIRTFTVTSRPGGVAFSPDGRRILVSDTGGADTLDVWGLETGAQIWAVPIQALWSGVAFSPDGQYVLATSFNKKSYLLDAATGQEIREFVGHTEGVFSGVFSPDGQYVLTSSLDQTARLWDVATGQEVRRFLGHTASVYWVAFSPDGHHILTAGKDSTARLWNIQSSPEQGTFSDAQGWMYGLAFSPDGQYVATGTNDNTARVFDTATGKQLHVFTHPSALQQVYFSPDSSMILTSDNDGIARLWDAASGEIVRTFDQGYATAYSPDGRYILTGGATTTLWDAHSSDKLYEVAHVGILAFSPDSQSFALTNEEDQAVYRYETATGTLLNSFPVPANPLVGVFSPDSKDIATAGRDNIIRLWDAASGQLVQQFVGHTNIIWTVAFSPAGRYILSGSQDKTARLWDTATGLQIRSFPSHNFSAISMVAYAPDGMSVLIGSSDGTAQLADVSKDRLIQSVCARLLRDFSDQERMIYSIPDSNPTCPIVQMQPTALAPTWTPVLTGTGT